MSIYDYIRRETHHVLNREVEREIGKDLKPVTLRLPPEEI